MKSFACQVTYQTRGNWEEPRKFGKNSERCCLPVGVKKRKSIKARGVSSVIQEYHGYARSVRQAQASESGLGVLRIG